jgi:hypothetical protein
MNCPVCGRYVEDLVCQHCVAEQSREALWKLQASYVEGARAGRVNFAGVRQAGEHPWHLRLFGDAAHAWCGRELLRPAAKNRRRLTWPEVTGVLRPRLCPECVRKLVEVAERAAIGPEKE